MDGLARSLAPLVASVQDVQQRASSVKNHLTTKVNAALDLIKAVDDRQKTQTQQTAEIQMTVEYVQLAMRKAGKGSKRKDDLAQVLHILDGREALEARILACCERNEQESVLRRVSLRGFDFSIHGLPDWRRQDQLVSAAYRGSLESVRNMLRVEGVADVNPLTSRLWAGFPRHPWPLSALLMARSEALPDAYLKETMRSVRRILSFGEYALRPGVRALEALARLDFVFGICARPVACALQIWS